MQRIFLTGTNLKAMQLGAAVKDVRYYLNGVFIEATQCETRLVATDGWMLAAFRTTVKNELDVPIVTLIVPNEVIKQVKPVKGVNDSLTIEIEDGRYTLISGDLRIGFRPLEGIYPDYRRILATRVSGVVGHYDPDRLAVLKKIGNTLRRSKNAIPYVHHNGEGNAVITFGCLPTFIGILMHDRNAAAKSEPEAWPALSEEDVQSIKDQREANVARLAA
ncbi:DNA polymerase III subunit beta [Burkholderia gladioli]|uniref:DNA polymerase III subunit beta family protein n=1 Tax=Burkholderia gladioli TaxID=28095 RepID=UPI003B50034B